MIRQLNRLYWLAYGCVVYLLYLVARHLVGMEIDNAILAALCIVFGVLFAGHAVFHAGGFALSLSVRQLPQVRDQKLPFQKAAEQGIRPLTPWGWFKAIWFESCASYALISWLQPWARHIDRIELADKAWRQTKPLPVLLIHGYLCNAAVWSSTRQRLAKLGVSTSAITLEPAIGSIRAYSEIIAQAIDDLKAATGAPRVKIIAHSMGGVALRYSVTEHGHANIDSVLTIGSPHYGTALSTLGVGKNVRQMAWASPFLKRLREHPADREFQGKITSIWSGQDNIVSPPCSSLLEFGQNLLINGSGHVALISHPIVTDWIEHWLVDAPVAYKQPVAG